MQAIQEYAGKAGDSLKNMGASAGEALSGLKDSLANNPSALAMLLGGGGSALAGGWLSSLSKSKDEEDPSERRKRILRNALLAGAAGAGAAGLGTAGWKNLSEAVPADEPSEIGSLTTGLGARGLAAGAAGGALYAKGLKNETQSIRNLVSGAVGRLNSNTSSTAEKDIARRLEGASKAVGESKFSLGSNLRDEFDYLRKNKAKAFGGLFDSSDVARVTGEDAQGVLKNFKDPAIGKRLGKALKMSPKQTVPIKKHLGRLIGRTPGSQVARGGLLGAALLYPEIAKTIGGFVEG